MLIPHVPQLQLLHPEFVALLVLRSQKVRNNVSWVGSRLGSTGIVSEFTHKVQKFLSIQDGTSIMQNQLTNPKSTSYLYNKLEWQKMKNQLKEIIHPYPKKI